MKIVSGKVVYDANKVILEESKDNSMSQLGDNSVSQVIPMDQKHKKINRVDTKNSSNNPDSNLSGEIDIIYAELDCE